MQLNIYTDGGARGNPGPAAIGVLVQDGMGRLLTKFGKRIGKATNNVAEYTAVIEALKWIRDQRSENRDQKMEKIQFFLDSSLVVNQLNGLFRVKDANLRSLLVRIRELEQEVGGNIYYTQIPREKNWQADRLVNQALDS